MGLSTHRWRLQRNSSPHQTLLEDPEPLWVEDQLEEMPAGTTESDPLPRIRPSHAHYNLTSHKNRHTLKKKHAISHDLKRACRTRLTTRMAARTLGRALSLKPALPHAQVLGRRLCIQIATAKSWNADLQLKRPVHINILELVAALRSLHAFKEKSRTKRCWWRSTTR